MGDATGGGIPGDPGNERVEALARKMLRNASENGLEPGDIDTARKIAARMLEDSEARTNDPATRDPENDGIIRRTSRETASSVDPQTRRTEDGE